MKKKIYLLSLALFFLLVPCFQPVSAHEAYVLTHTEFQQGLAEQSLHPLAPLLDTTYFRTTVLITLAVMATYTIAIIWASTPWAARIDQYIKKGKVAGPLIIRGAISAAFFYAALANSILGPELSLTAVNGGEVIRFLLILLSLMIFLGFFTEVAAAIGLGLFIYVTFNFGNYMITYSNYFGELLVLLLFGSRFWSFDRLFFGKRTLISFFEKFLYLEVPIVRILYGIALIYAGWTIKFSHQSLSVAVYNQYHLINFFHAAASFIAAGAGLSEILIGLFILIGFAQRLTVVISLIFITLSILYFREMLWPHFMLYGISFSLIINSADRFTIDRYLIPFVRRVLGIRLAPSSSRAKRKRSS